MADCRKLRPTGLYDGRQGFTYNEGVSAQSVGSQGICMHLPDHSPRRPRPGAQACEP